LGITGKSERRKKNGRGTCGTSHGNADLPRKRTAKSVNDPTTEKEKKKSTDGGVLCRTGV